MKTFAFIYKNGHDCTIGGFSSKCDHAELRIKRERGGVGDALGFSEQEAKNIADMESHTDFLIAVEDICGGERRVRAIPASLLRSGVWTMFGGNFIYSSDSRSFSHPVKIHDRVEGNR